MSEFSQADPPLIPIDKLVVGGRGMGRLEDGRPLFASGAFPGDRLRVLETRDRKSYAEALRFDVLEPSPHRVEPPCPVCSTCGGCDWMPLSEEGQDQGKLSLLEAALTRLGRIDVSSLKQPLRLNTSDKRLGYRSRVRLQVQGGRVGFFSARSHELVEAERCLVASSALWDAVLHVRRAVHQKPHAFADVRHVEVRVLGEGPLVPERTSAAFDLGVGKGTFRKPSEDLKQATAGLRDVMTVRLGRGQAPRQSFASVLDVAVPAPVGGFTQVNEGVNRLLVERVVELAGQAQAKSFVDLYCGSGNFSLPLAKAGLAGVGVERAEEAITWARAAAEEQGLHVEYFSVDSARFLARAAREERHFDMAIVDPPRAGAKDILEDLLRVAPPLIIMVSCDPATLARDLRTLVDGGYRLESVEGFDMFPQTHHLESLAVLRR